MEVAELIALVIDPDEGDEIYDPTCGTSGLLIKSNTTLRKKSGNSENADFPKCYGQEINRSTYAMAKMNAIIHDMQETEIAIGDTMIRPAFRMSDGKLRRFDKVIANPMWNQKFDQSVYENDSFGRFAFGYPTSSSADWAWIQHMFASLKDKGKLAVVIDTGSVSRGSGSEGANREKEIRKKFVENDLIESVILLPENLFYNTTAPGVIITINKSKQNKDKILMINASRMFEKGRPKNFIPEERITEIYGIYSDWKEIEGTSKILVKADLVKADYNLSPSRFISQNNEEELVPIDEIISKIRNMEVERKKNDGLLNDILKQLGYEEY
jgi:type I restriction enzyme M protein